MNIRDVLNSYCDSDLNEIIAEKSQNYFEQKDVPKRKILTPSTIQKTARLPQKKVANNVVTPVFSTTDALSALAKKTQNGNVSQAQPSQGFVSLNDIVAKAKKFAGEAKNLEELRVAIANFDGCNLKKMATNTVFCDGNPQSDVMVIGEAPGNHEDLQGRPFCDDAGKLLDAMFGAIDMTRDDIYIGNVVFWRPPGNRRPTQEELAICRPFLERQIVLADPKILVLVGATAMKALTDIDDPISKVRGKLMDFESEFLPKKIKTFTMFHPSYLMRQTSKKRLAWMDMLALQTFLQTK